MLLPSTPCTTRAAAAAAAVVITAVLMPLLLSLRMSAPNIHAAVLL